MTGGGESREGDCCDKGSHVYLGEIGSEKGKRNDLAEAGENGMCLQGVGRVLGEHE